MKSNVMYCLTVIIVVISCFLPSDIAVASTTIILLDMSGSMDGDLSGGRSKAQEATRVVREEVIPKLANGNDAGLWVIGTGYCDRLRFQGNITSQASSVQNDLRNIGNPNGTTPLAWAIREALAKLKSSSEPRHLIVVTDGIEECGGDPCAEVKKGHAQQMEISVHTVGLGMSKNSAAFNVLQCISNSSHEGVSGTAENPQELQNILEKIVTTKVVPEEQKGELLVEVIDSTGQKTLGASYSISAGQGSQTGKTGTPLSLVVGTYQIEFGNKTQNVIISPNQRETVQFKSDLGHFIAYSTCGDPDMMFTLLDYAKNVVATATLSEELDLPAGEYSLMLAAYPYLSPKPVKINNNAITEVNVGNFGEVEITAQDASGNAIHLPLEIYDNSRVGSMPVATGETNKTFRLPEGTYNILPSPSSEFAGQMKGGTNISVVQCQKAQPQIKQEACLAIQSNIQGRITIYDNSTQGKTYSGTIGRCIGLPIGIYNIRCPNGAMLTNIEVSEGENEETCP